MSLSLNHHAFRKALQLSLNEMGVLKEIYDLSHSRYCIKSKQKIAETLDLSERVVFDIIKMLTFKGYLIRNKKGGLKPTDFIIEISQETDRFAFIIKSDNYTLASSKIFQFVEDYKKNYTMQKVQSDYAESADDTMQKVQTSNTIEYTQSNSIAENEIFAEREEVFSIKTPPIPFDEFWDLYGKKVGDKAKCISYWNKLKDEERQKIIKTLPHFKQSIKDIQFLPYPQKYLSGKRWNDFVEDKKNTSLEEKYKGILKNISPE